MAALENKYLWLTFSIKKIRGDKDLKSMQKSPLFYYNKVSTDSFTNLYDIITKNNRCVIL